MLYRLLLVAFAASVSAFQGPAAAAGRSPVAAARATRPVMDETIMQKALAGELEEEGAENVFMSELGWATYLDKAAGSSYNMNERVSQASDGYFTPTILSNPADVVSSWLASLKGVAEDPLSVGFPTISNDKSGNRAYPKGLGEVNARTIKPKVKNFDSKMRIVGIPGFNAFGSPSSKQEGKLFGIF